MSSEELKNIQKSLTEIRNALKLLVLNSTVNVKGITAGDKVSRRKVKDPNAPKSSLSAFLHYSITERAATIKRFPELERHPTEVSKKLGALWKELTVEKRRPYVEMAAKDKARYVRELEAYNKTKEAGEGAGAAEPVAAAVPEEEDVEVEVEDEPEEVSSEEERVPTPPPPPKKTARKKKAGGKAKKVQHSDSEPEIGRDDD